MTPIKNAQRGIGSVSAWKADALPTELLPRSRGGRARTADLTVPNRARYQLRYTPNISVNLDTNVVL